MQEGGPHAHNCAEGGPHAHTCAEGVSTRPHQCRRGVNTPTPVQKGGHTPTPVQKGVHTPTPVQKGVHTPTPVQKGCPHAHTSAEGGSTRPHQCRRGVTRPHLCRRGVHTPTPVQKRGHTPTPVSCGVGYLGLFFPAEMSVSAFCSSRFENVLSSFLFIWIFRLSFQTSHFLSLLPLVFRQATECSCICCASVETDDKPPESRGTPDLFLSLLLPCYAILPIFRLLCWPTTTTEALLSLYWSVLWSLAEGALRQLISLSVVTAPKP